jgi:hypothetical protein
MPGEICVFYGCPSSRKHGLSFLKIPSVCAGESEHTTTLKASARKEWLNIILRTRELTPELKTQIDVGNIYLCELHFKPEWILTSICIAFSATSYIVA